MTPRNLRIEDYRLLTPRLAGIVYRASRMRRSFKEPRSNMRIRTVLFDIGSLQSTREGQ